MKLNFINEAKLNDSQLATVDKLIRRLNDMKKGDYTEKHGGWGTYRNLTKYLSEIETSLHNTQELEIYGIPPTILKLVEKYPESIKVLKDKFNVINPTTGGIEEFYFESMRSERRTANENGTKGKTKSEDKMITMLRNRQGYRALKNYVNYLRKAGFAGTKGLELSKLKLKMPHITLVVGHMNRMYGVPHGDHAKFSIETNDEYLRVEELINTVNEVQLAAKTLGIDIDEAWVTTESWQGVLYTLNKPRYNDDGRRGWVGGTNHDRNGGTIRKYVNIDSENIESVQDAYREIKKAIEESDSTERDLPSTMNHL